MYRYQWGTVERIVDRTHTGEFMDMGLGKTVSTLTAIDILIFQEFLVDKVLVIAPKRVAESVWMQETQEWDHLQHLKTSIITGTEKQRRAALKVKADVYTIARDNVVWLCGLFGGSSLPFDMVVIDESSSFKNPKSQRFKALKLVQPSVDRIVLLTGTPSPNGLIDIWSQVYLLDRGERLGRTISEYRRDFFRPDKQNGHIVYSYALRKGAEGLIYDAIWDVCTSMKASDYLDLPPRITNIVRIPMPDALKKAYKEFEREQVLELFDEDTTITAANAAALSNKLLQFANGAVYDTEKEWHEVHKLKIDALIDILEDANGQPVLLAWTYRHDAERIEKYLKKYKPVRLDTDKNIRDWNAGKIRLLIMHPASGGHGLNLQKGGHIAVWFGQTWSLEYKQQFDARLDRQGQKESVIIHHLITEGTMDEEVLLAQDRKDKGQRGLMDAVKAKVRRIARQSL